MQIQIDYQPIIQQFRVVRKHLFQDKIYSLYLFSDQLIITQLSSHQNSNFINISSQLMCKQIFFGASIKKAQLPPSLFPFKIKINNSMQILKTYSIYITIQNAKYSIETSISILVKFKRQVMATFPQYLINFYTFFHQVYKYYSRIDQKYVAVKVMNKLEIFSEKQRMNQLCYEIQTLSCVKDSIWEDDKKFYLITELLEGYTLSHELELKPSGISEIIIMNIITQILEAVNHLHLNGIMHRDLNPSNIQFVNQKDIQVKIIDFGIAQFVHDDYFPLQKCGTPGYLGPELASYREKDPLYNEKVDIFACGCILFRMLSGFNLFRGNMKQNVFSQNKECKIDFSSFQNLGINNTLTVQQLINQNAQKIMKRMLDVNPRNRITAKQSIMMINLYRFQCLKDRSVTISDQYVIEEENVELINIPQFDQNITFSLTDKKQKQLEESQAPTTQEQFFNQKFQD